MKTILEQWERKEIWRVAIEITCKSSTATPAFPNLVNDVKKAYLDLFDVQAEVQEGPTVVGLDSTQRQR